MSGNGFDVNISHPVLESNGMFQTEGTEELLKLRQPIKSYTEQLWAPVFLPLILWTSAEVLTFITANFD